MFSVSSTVMGKKLKSHCDGHLKFCAEIHHKHLHSMHEILFVNGQLQTDISTKL